eukprot:jgi/Tetstr1/443183/TSEL_031223.t1
MEPIPFGFRQIDYVIAVAETGSTSAAARLVNVSQPSVSLAVTRLEETLGQPLFRRAAGQGMTPTAFGRRKLVEFRSLRAQMRALLATDDGSGALPPVLELGVFSTLGPRYVPALIRAFRTKLPGARLRLHEADLETLHAWLESGRIDLALVYDFGAVADVEMVPLIDVPPYALVAGDHPLATRQSVDLATLLRDPLILVNLPQSRDYFLSVIQSRGLTAEIALETGSTEMLRSMVASGLGVGLLATRLPYRTTYDGGEVAHLTLEDPVPAHRVALARPARLPGTWVARAFEEVAGEVFARLQ